tara:strand:+ start:2524 stop:2739 length:216 start_codon:yes stop_codon:yes gene_type:complete
MSKVYDYFKEREEMGVHELAYPKMILCDGDCGTVRQESEMNYTHDGQNLCKECMFHWAWQQEYEEQRWEHE